MKKRVFFSFFEHCPGHEHIQDIEVRMSVVPRLDEKIDPEGMLPGEMVLQMKRSFSSYYVREIVHRFRPNEQWITLMLGIRENWQWAVNRHGSAQN
ncbi:hypothetical protein ACWKWU_15055 [Chitinophaga lutea]